MTSEKEWITAMDEAKMLYDKGESNFTVNCALENARRLYYKMNEELEEDVTWDKWEKLMDIAEDLFDREKPYKEVHNALNAAKAMYKRIREKEIDAKRLKKVSKAKEEEADNQTFEETGKIVGRLVDEKNAKYGDSFGKSGGVFKILYPDGIQPDQYDDMLTLTRILDKLFRVATDKDAFGESPWTDIAGYGILKVNASRKEKS